ncbi:GntR family transcriptional regulator [Streptomyces sp. NPDC056244]|uniref:GntR family transcriptional regulator n=1 Tax=Streptomyces sp. NPDC056244 TaxID=3345762 RepID=UPI0035DD054A
MTTEVVGSMAEQRRTLVAAEPGAEQPARRLSLTEQVYHRLKEEILQVRHGPGELLLEPELATRYGISKTPVREALRLLLQDGWVLVMPRKGYLVRPVRLEDIREVFEVRRMIEPVMAGQAAHLRTDDDIARLSGLCSEQSRDAESIEPALGAARAFHSELAALTGNGRALAILTDQLDEVRRLHHLMPKAEHHITSTVELDAHRQILAAVEAKDARAAADLMSDHVTEVAEAMVDAFAGMRR